MAIDNSDLFIVQKVGGELRKASFEDLKDEVLTGVPEAPESGIPEAPDNGNQYARQNKGWEVVDVPTVTSDLTNDSGFITSADIPSPVVPGDGTLTIKNSDGEAIGTFSANQATGDNTEITLPAGFSGDYDDLTNKPNPTLRVTTTVSSATQSVFDTSPVAITSGSELVYLNGTLLNSGSDYDVTGDSEVTLDNAAVLGDVFELFSNDTITGERVKQNLGYQKRASSGVVTITDGSNAVIDGATTADAGLLTAADKTKLNGIEQGAEVNIQSDWLAPNTSDAHIKTNLQLVGTFC